MEKQRIVHEISIGSVLKVLSVLFGLYLLFLIRDILMLILVVFVISIALEPFVNKLSKQGVPRALSVIVLYFALLIILGLFIYFIVPPVVMQLREFSLNLPYSSEKLSQIDLTDTTSTISQLVNTLTSKAAPITGSLVNGIISLFGGVVSAITVFVLTFYVVVDSDSLRQSFSKIIPVERRDRLAITLKRVSEKLGRWLRGQLTLMAIIGIINGTVLWALDIGFPLTLGILSGLLEIVPVVGPIVATVITVFVAFVTGAPLWKIVLAVSIFVVVQQLQNQVLIPKIMQKAVGLSPIAVILAILIGSKLMGIGGAILAVPLAAGIHVFIEEYSTVFRKKT